MLSRTYRLLRIVKMSLLDIRTKAQECSIQFELLIEIKGELATLAEASNDTHDVGWIEDQYARFKMWAGNIGAFADGHASLDHRLRDSEETRDFMIGFLTSLKDFIQRGKAPQPCCCGSDRLLTCS